jgi:hypothetical protein
MSPHTCHVSLSEKKEKKTNNQVTIKCSYLIFQKAKKVKFSIFGAFKRDMIARKKTKKKKKKKCLDYMCLVYYSKTTSFRVSGK